jgi:hypothetical protein
VNEVDDFLARHGEEIGLIVETFNGNSPPRGVVKFLTVSERCWREHGRPLADEEFEAALKFFDDDE